MDLGSCAAKQPAEILLPPNLKLGQTQGSVPKSMVDFGGTETTANCPFSGFGGCFFSSHSTWPFPARMDRAASVSNPFHCKGKKMYKGGCNKELLTSCERQKCEDLRKRLLKNGRWRQSEVWRCSSSNASRHMHLLESMGQNCLVTFPYFAVSAFKSILLEVNFAKNNKAQMPFSACHNFFDQPT